MAQARPTEFRREPPWPETEDSALILLARELEPEDHVSFDPVPAPDWLPDEA